VHGSLYCKAACGCSRRGELALYQMIPTQFADVVSAFSLQSHKLGLYRLSTQVCKLYCRLQVKPFLPAAFTNAHEAAEVEMQLENTGAGPETQLERVNSVEIYKQMLLPDGAESLTKRFNEVLNIDKSLVWQKLADESDAVKAVAMHESVADEAETGVGSREDGGIRELERLLTVGQDRSPGQRRYTRTLLEMDACT
jgi:hypothetical protein